jgi:hypothetical protein
MDEQQKEQNAAAEFIGAILWIVLGSSVLAYILIYVFEPFFMRAWAIGCAIALIVGIVAVIGYNLIGLAGMTKRRKDQ